MGRGQNSEQCFFNGPLKDVTGNCKSYCRNFCYIDLKMGSCCSSSKKRERRGGSVDSGGGSAGGESFGGNDQGYIKSIKNILLVNKHLFLKIVSKISCFFTSWKFY